MNYIEELANYEYIESVRQQQESLESYINECIILAEEDHIVEKLRSFNEAEKKGFFESIKSGFKKFIEFIKNMFGRFASNVQRFANNKKWLENNKDIILKNPVKLGVYKMHDYATGIKRLSSDTSRVPKYVVEGMDDKLTDEKTCYEWMASQVGYNNYKYVDEDDFKTVLLGYFEGGSNQKVIDTAALNMTDIYNYCYNYDTITNILNKDQTVIENSMNAAIANIDTKIENGEFENKEDNTENKEDKNTEDNTENKNTDTNKKEKDKPITNPNSENKKKNKGVIYRGEEENTIIYDKNAYIGDDSYAFSRVYSTYITEADDEDTTNSKMTKINNASKNDVGKSATITGKGNTAADAIKSQELDADEAEKNANDKIDKTNTYEDLQELSKQFELYRDAASAVFSAKLTAAEKIYKEYITLLSKHVNMYKGKEQPNSKTASKATNYKNNDNKKQNNENNGNDNKEGNNNKQEEGNDKDNKK